MHIEVITRKPKQVSHTKPKLVFVHGICVGAWVWDAHFLPYFAKHGYEAHALSLRGHGESGGKEHLSTWFLSDYVNDLEDVVAELDGPVVVVGHSLGGAVVQDWLRTGFSRDKAAGVALLASVPPWGLGYAAAHMGAMYPHLYCEIARMLAMGTQHINQDVMRMALFSDDLPTKTFNTFIDKVHDESVMVSSEVLGMRHFAPFPWVPHAPVFVAGAANDRFIPAMEVHRTAAYYKNIATVVPDLAHAVMLDTHWEHMAEHLHGWVQGL